MSKLINASNLHVGGGVQVATSVIAELVQMPSLPADLVIWASTAVNENLRKLDCDLSRLPAYEVINSYGLKLLCSPLAFRIQSYDAVFTIFGPLYVWKLTGINITGFAQPWIIYPDNEIYQSSGWCRRLLTYLKFGLQIAFFKRADQLVVELDHVREGILRRDIGVVSTIHVVHNSLSSLYLMPEKWQAVLLPDMGCNLKLGFIGRNYEHKNTRIFPEVIEALRCKHGINASVYVTFSEEEWAACDDVFRSAVINVGSLSVAQCPLFYNGMDAVIFPSLLECFSATPLETMAMEKPLFASDRPFNWDVCKDYAYYFDPLSPTSAADAIAQVFANGAPNQEMLQAARSHAISFSNPKERANKYLHLLIQSSKKSDI